MTTDTLTIRIRGRDRLVPVISTGRCKLVRTGRFPRVINVFDEDLVEEAGFPSPREAIAAIEQAGLGAEYFCFARPFASNDAIEPYPHIVDNLAVVDTTSFDLWWNALPQEARKNMRLAGKRGVTVRTAVFDDAFVRGIKDIYDETPVRQGRTFWHYQKPLERVREMNATYLERSHFIGAYIGDELIGFIKYITVDRVAHLIQILAKESHRDKRTVNALLRQTVENCHQQGMAFLTYGKFDYGVQLDSGLTEFKRRNGFRELSFPRYYVPLSFVGRLCLAAGIHKGWTAFVPARVRTWLHRARARWMEARKNPANKGAA